MSFWLKALVTGVLAVVLGLQLIQRVNIPKHLLGHKAIFVEDFLKAETSEKLRNLMKTMELPTNQQDVKFYSVKHEHIGEIEPLKDGKCSHAFLVPDVNRTGCVLPGRIDVGRHFIRTGGVEGLKEKYDVGISRLQSFGRYIFDLDEFPIVKDLFGEENFLAAAKKICPPNKQVLDPFQFNFIVQAPGQSVALHLDAPYLWGATRFQFPQWLLAAMVYSGLFTDRFIDQVQVVGYFHRWNDTNNERDGRFVYWDESVPQYKSVPCSANAGSVVDGSKTVHAAGVYYPGCAPAPLDKNKNNRLVYAGEEKWNLLSDDETVTVFDTDELRMTIVFRARCFESEEKLQYFKTMPDEDYMKLEEILNTFEADMLKKGVISATEGRGKPLDFALKIMDTYITYPLPPFAYVPYNYCALARLVPSLAPILNLIC